MKDIPYICRLVLGLPFVKGRGKESKSLRPTTLDHEIYLEFKPIISSNSLTMIVFYDYCLAKKFNSSQHM